MPAGAPSFLRRRRVADRGGLAPILAVRGQDGKTRRQADFGPILATNGQDARQAGARFGDVVASKPGRPRPANLLASLLWREDARPGEGRRLGPTEHLSPSAAVKKYFVLGLAFAAALAAVALL